MKESKNEEGPYENTGDVLVREARLNGMLGHYTALDKPWPVVHVGVKDQREHDPHETCWCQPEIEFHTDFVRVYRHRRLQ